MFLALDKMEQPPALGTGTTANSQDRTLQLESELREKNQEIHQLKLQLTKTEREVIGLQGEIDSERDTVARLQKEAKEEKEKMTILLEALDKEKRKVIELSGEVDEEKETVTRLREEMRMKVQESNRHTAELQQMREEHRHQLSEERALKQRLEARIDRAMANLRGDAIKTDLQGDVTASEPLALWELPREDVHISQKLIGTGGWGYVAEGTFHGKTVAVKCLHRAILSPKNEGRVRREISIMAQIRHPNLLLLIGAVLTTERTGPLIVTELLDKSLRSAYEEGLLEERCKVPILKDVATALAYLHSHRTPIIHRDVSSANVLLEETKPALQWKAKLSDFGSANLSHIASTPFEGAAVYSAPEVNTEDRSRQTPRIDVYSYGVLVCEVTLCRFPPDASQFSSMLRDVHQTTPNMFPLARDCTSKAHKDRPSMKEVLERLNLAS